MKIEKPNLTLKPVSKPGQFQKLLADAGQVKAMPRDRVPTEKVLLPGVAAKKPVSGSQAITEPMPRVAPPVASGPQQVVSVHQKTAHTLQTARQSMSAEAQRLNTTRVHNVEQQTQKIDERVIDLICTELVTSFNADPSQAKPANQDLVPTTRLLPPPMQVGVAGLNPQNPEVKANAAVELIEKIEVFVKSQRPALALTLNNSLGARVEIERIGPREVALKVVGKDGPPNPEDVGRIRDEMRARGLKVSALSVA